MVNVFAAPVFFICFRECLETSIIVSILLAFLKQTLDRQADERTYKALRRQVWVGTALGLLICIIIGAGMIGAFYGIKKNTWQSAEPIWEGVFALIATIIITIMGAALLRISKLQAKWRVKLAKSLEASDNKKAPAGSRIKRWTEKYAMFVLPFITVLREGLEAVVFIGGVGVGLPATAFPIPVITGLLAGALIGYLIYRGCGMAKIQIALIISTCFLYLIAAGLFSRAVGFFEQYKYNKLVGGDAAETGSGPGSYDIRYSVWHVNCCNPELSGGWGIFNSLFGWTNSATYGTVISYNVYWIVVILFFLAMRYNEVKGHWPLMKAKSAPSAEELKTASDSDLSGHNSRGETAQEVKEVKDIKA